MEINLNLETLLSHNEDSISGRKFGQGYAERENIMKKLEEGCTFKIVVGNKIKAINDSFWKGFFNFVFKKYKTKEEVKSKFKIEGNDFFEEILDKNFEVLEAIYNI